MRARTRGIVRAHQSPEMKPRKTAGEAKTPTRAREGIVTIVAKCYGDLAQPKSAYYVLAAPSLSGLST